jgi:PAS domain S-box-containing protein
MLSASAELARSALDAAPDAMVIADEAGIIRYANRQVSALFGYTHEQLIGQGIEQLLPERLRGQHVAHRHEYSTTPRLRPMGQGLILLGRRQDGSEFPVEISLSPIHDSERMLVAAAIRDVTDRKRVETELRIARQTSEQARESANRANQAKGRFLATASHDLRQPLQTLALLNGALRRMVTGGDADEVLSQQEHAIGAMSRLLNALLDISKLESGAVEAHPADFKVGSLLEGLRREFTALAASKGLALELEPADEYAHSDPALVEQILKNLVSNAIKYTRQGRVLLRCQPEEGAVRVDVRDTGIGIPADQLAYIYDEFYQVGVPANSSRDGYGLGLSIVQRLVRLLNLRLEVASEVGKGSEFSLILPTGKSPQASSPPERGVRPEGVAQTRRPSVLLVEDDPGVRDATRMLLAVEGYRVTAVSSALEALRWVQEHGTPDLVIADYHLGAGQLGTQVIEELRSSSGTVVKAVLITGDTSAVIKHLSSDPHLRIASKPVNAEELLSLLRALTAG